MTIGPIRLPLPPSVNSCWINRPKGQRGRGRIPTKAYTDWKEAAGWTVKTAVKNQKISGPYRLKIMVPVTMRGDVDNRIKPICDLLVELGVTPDDRHLQSVSCERSKDVGNYCSILVEEST